MLFGHFILRASGLLLLAIIQSHAAAEPIPLFKRHSCTTGDGAIGNCQSTSSCGSSGGTSTPGFCPGAADIQCCTYGSCTLDSGEAGSCTPTSGCSGTSTPGYCPGPTDIQCCTSKSTRGNDSGGGSSSSSSSSSSGNLPRLNSIQSGHARTIIKEVHENALPIRACEVAIATAMQESSIRVLANTKVPESLDYPHDGEGSDYDSVGIFQQRPKFWGTVQDCMDPASSADKFLKKLKTVSGWESKTIAQAAQAVQGSAYPDAYAKWVTLATDVCKVAF